MKRFGFALIPAFLLACHPHPVVDNIDMGTPQSGTCRASDLRPGCTVGHCVLSLPRQLTGHEDAHDNTVIAQLSEEAVPSELTLDAYGPSVCVVTLEDGVQLADDLVLSISYDTAALSAILFRKQGNESANLIEAVQIEPKRVEGLIGQSGRYGATARPGGNSSSSYGTDSLSSATLAAYVRNLSSTIRAAFFDGQHLYLGTNNRILIFSGLPSSPDDRPVVVLGQPDLDSRQSGNSAAVFQSGVNGLWSDGTKLAASVGNRVLLWKTIPTANETPADLVLGEPDFSAAAPGDPVTGSTLNSPGAIDSDGNRVAVVDTLNHRLLIWNSFPTEVGQPASLAIGQPTLFSSDGDIGATPLQQPIGVALVSTGLFVSSRDGIPMAHVPSFTMNAAYDFQVTSGSSAVQPDAFRVAGGVARVGSGLAVRDSGGDRIAIYTNVPTEPTDFQTTLGQPDGARQVRSPISASTLSHNDSAVSGASRVLLAPDSNRLLILDHVPSDNFEPATAVLGQAGFSTNLSRADYRGISATTLADPADVALTSDTVAVTDRGNNRVLLYSRSGLATGAAATVVLGQTDAQSFVPNLDQHTPSAARLSGPAGVALDGTHLIVADTENHRVLIWNTVPTQTGAAADLVLGQSNFSGNRPNRGRGDLNPQDGFSDADSDGFFAPTGVASDGTHLFVSDRLNHRILGWNTFPTSNGQAADAVIGQANFTANLANRGQGVRAAVANGFNLPTGLHLAGASLWVADTENNRVLRYDNATTSPTLALVIGQADGATVNNWNYRADGSATAPATTSLSVLRPRGITVAGGNLIVAEADSHRVRVFDQNSGLAIGRVGQPNDQSATVNSGGISAASLSAPAGISGDDKTLLVADGGNHRVLGFSQPSLLPMASPPLADLALGQPTAVSNGFNQSTTAQGGVVQSPRGVARYGNLLYVADSDHHRVLALPSDSPGGTPTVVYGQPDGALALPNSGAAASASTLQSPKGVYVDSTRVIIADSGNHRVLVFDRASSSTTAELVLGQTGFSGSAANAGASATAATLRNPEGVYFDGTHLYVADTGNHRVLEWNSFPTSNGQAADAVIGQTTFTDNQPNQGLDGPSASTLLFPIGLRVIASALYVADSGNNRVLRFSTPLANSAAARDVLGQPNFSARLPGNTESDRTLLAGPTAIDSDGTFIYVLDRDLGRVIAFDRDATTGTAAHRSYGAADGFTVDGSGGLAVENTTLFQTRLWLSATHGDQVQRIDGVSRLLQQNP